MTTQTAACSPPPVPLPVVPVGTGAGAGTGAGTGAGRSTGICGVPSGVHVPKGNAVKIMARVEPRFGTLLAPVVTR